MPEGPSIVIVKESAQQFTGQKVVDVIGNTKAAVNLAEGKKIIAFKSWGKHFLICFNGFTIKIHFMLFGSYLINDDKKAAVRLGLIFKKGKINFYACQVTILDGDINSHYDWSADVMSDDWNAAAAFKKIRAEDNNLIADVLLDQHIFSGVGNIIKNEVLFRVKVHPDSRTGAISDAKLRSIIKEARQYSFEFLEWKKMFVLKKHWLVYSKKICPHCNMPLIKKNTGRSRRRSFYCTTCQKLYL